MTDNIAQRLLQLNEEITQANTNNTPVTLVAVSKTKPAQAIREAFAAGQKDFGENYLQECLSKQAELSDLAIVWHYIGPIQSNKTQQIAQHFTWVHSVDRLKIAKRLNDARPLEMEALQICIQVNISNENTKSGISINELEGLATAFSAFPRLKLRGLMAIPAPTEDTDQQIAQFQAVQNAFNQLNAKGFALDTLSMGMSNDYIPAVKQGATMVRIGSKIFGVREKKIHKKSV